MKRSRSIESLAIALDLLLGLLIGVGLLGGIPWGEHVLFHHGADIRRAILILGVAAAFGMPRLQERSFFLKSAFRLIAKLTQEPSWRWGILSFACLWAIVLGVFQTLALRFPMYDVGLFHQILWSLAHGYGFTSTISGAGNFLNDHYSPSLVFLVPFYWIAGSSPLILGILHPLLIFGGAAAWLFLAERLPGVAIERRNRIACATVIFILGFDSLWGNLRWGFHENSISFFALSWAFALFFSRRAQPLVILPLLLISAGAKEILLLDVALVLLIWSALNFRRPRWQLSLSIFTALILIAQFIAFEKAPHPEAKNYFHRYYGYLGADLESFLNTLIHSPTKVVQTVGGLELLKYLKAVLLPWLALPFFLGSESVWLFVICPSFLSAALATYPPLRHASFHYVLELWPIMACLTVVAFGRIKSRPWLIWVWAFLALLAMDHDPWGEIRDFYHEALNRSSVRAEMASTSELDSVSADERSGTWLAGRLRVTRWPDVSAFAGQCPDWVWLDGSGPRNLEKPCESIHFLKEVDGWRVFKRGSGAF